MLQEQSRFFQRLLFFADFFVVALAWVGAYYLRFEVFARWPVPLPEWLPLDAYLRFLPWFLIVSSFAFWASGLYVPDRAQRLTRLVFSVAKAVALFLLVVAASLTFYREFYVSRLTLAFFGLLTPVLMVALRLVLYVYLRRARLRGRNLKRVLIIGAGHAGRRLERSFALYPWMGFEVVGFLDDAPRGAPDVLGTVDDAIAVVDRFEREGRPLDYVYIALPLSATARIEPLLDAFATRLPHVCLVPDLLQYDIINSRITDVDGLPVIHVIDEAPLEFRRFVKRGVDVVFSALFLVLAAPLLLAIAVAVKLSSPGPVFYRQERMSLNGQTFAMLKFRSMPVDAEAGTGAVWARPGEDRATPVGRFLRRTSLDELPQFINVLRGDMSVVGPRPERPVFIEQFRDQIPRYMLRHKVKAGITGWAQVHGWRGNTSLEKRIQYDLYYIQNWSLRLDFKIMLMTLWKGFVHENAY
ncbi:MAG: undecaprenyl-phosphate glucose phosphotransferase [Rhodothermales bacterium]|nr:undecaprenyl-phosphate glucose phosphotransferase [Rhodothermales bacterium]